MLIRRALIADAPAARRCVSAVLNATYGGLWTSAPLVADEAGWEDAWVAIAADGLIVGVGLSAGDVVSDLWVDPAAQRQGAGSKLLAVLEREIAGRGVTRGHLRCLEVNTRARAFYAARGWIERRVYAHETLPVNTVDMEKRLAPS